MLWYRGAGFLRGSPLRNPSFYFFFFSFQFTPFLLLYLFFLQLNKEHFNKCNPSTSRISEYRPHLNFAEHSYSDISIEVAMIRNDFCDTKTRNRAMAFK